MVIIGVETEACPTLAFAGRESRATPLEHESCFHSVITSVESLITQGPSAADKHTNACGSDAHRGSGKVSSDPSGLHHSCDSSLTPEITILVIITIYGHMCYN